MEDTWEGRHALLSYTALVATQAQPLVSLATTTRPSCITTHLPVACENVRHKQLHAGQPSGMGAARLHAKHSLLPPAHLIILPLAQVE